jgi:uncharacterized membrane protein YqiK
MTFSASALWAAIGRYAVRAVGGPVFLTRAIAVATVSVAHTLIRLVSAGLASDLGRVKEVLLSKLEAEAASKDAEAVAAQAEAQKKLAEAAEAANRANLPKRRDAIAKAERQKARAEAAKTLAEADAIRTDAETKRTRAVAEAYSLLLEALSKLRQDGGELIVDTEQLRKLLHTPPSHRNE